MKKTILALFLMAISAVLFAQDSMRVMNSDISGRVAARDMRGETDPPALPVLETYLPPEAISMATGKYGKSLYSIKQLKVGSGDSALQVVLLENGMIREEWVGGDGMVVTNAYRMDTGAMAMDRPMNNNMNNSNMNNMNRKDSMNNMNRDTAVSNMNEQPVMVDTTRVSDMSPEQGVMVGGSMMVPSKNIVENALGSNEHTTLVAAVQAAGLAETLSGTGPFTVFAPTNEAFNKLPAGTVDNLVKPEMKNDLTKILTYHVVSGALRATDLVDGQKLKTVQGNELIVNVKDGKVMIDGANVTTADVISSNGVTHVIDTVLMPKN
jgi:uncharacterized surface protein with fasciclin (FAS1) repeats